MVNGVEREHAVQGLVLEHHILGAGVDRREIVDVISFEMPRELGQHLTADIDAGELQIAEVTKQQEIVPSGPATDIRGYNGGTAGKLVADMEDRLLVGGPHVAIDVRDLGEMVLCAVSIFLGSVNGPHRVFRLFAGND